MTDITGQAVAEGNQSRGALNRAHRDNHRLPYREGVATSAQMAATEQALDILLRRIQNAPTEERLKRGGLVARIMADLGRDAAQLVQLRRIHLEGDMGEPPPTWGLISWSTGEGIKYGWWLSAGVDFHQKTHDGGESMRGAIWLPVLKRTHPWIAALGRLAAGEPQSLLHGTEADIRRDLAAFRAWAQATLGPLGKVLPNTRRLRGALTQKLMWEPTGDWALANQISGRDMKRSPARSSYTSLATQKAAKIYARAHTKSEPKAVSELSLISAADGLDALALPAFAKAALTRKKPDGASDTSQMSDTMQAMLDMLRTKPDHRHRSDVSKVIEAHNDFVAKVWILLALNMAIRSRTNWVPGLQRIEPRSGGLVVLDKDVAKNEPPEQIDGRTPGGMLGRARVVFLHPSARSILHQYIAHLRKLGRRNDVDDTSKELIANHVSGLEADALLPFLALAHHRKAGMIAAREVPPSWISKRLKGLADVPDNFGRHAMRSALVGQVPQSAINALLGHFDQGTEPWANGSAFDPAAYRALATAFHDAHFADVAGFASPGE